VTIAARDWLPTEAFSESAVKAALAGPVERWSKRWFAKGAAGVGTVHPAEIAEPSAQSRIVTGMLAQAELTGRGKRVLLEAALDVELAGQTLSEGDHAVLEAFAGAALQDLVSVLDETFRSAADDAGPRLRIALTLGGSDLLAVTVPRYAIVPALRARLGAARNTKDVLKSRLGALASTNVTAEAVLGLAELSFADLNNLGVGDVVILDRALQDPVDLRLSGGQRIGRGKLSRNGGRVAIQL
jgi:flagellar motor switch/type III secretory pathway protein FliN